MNRPVVMLCSDCFSTVALYNHISRFYAIDQVIEEKPMRGWPLAKRRFKKLGFFTVTGQILFSVIIVKLLRITSKKRIAEIKDRYRFDETAIHESKKKHVLSVNDNGCIDLIKTIQPGVILVNGTRILSKQLLESTDAVIINMHTGITPRYRGVHGAYWALVKNDYEHCGVTVHLVDKGIDTGNILYQSVIGVNKKDNYVTYPYLQFGEGIPLVKSAIDDSMAGKPVIRPPQMSDSKLWYHPTIWKYVYNRIFRNKK
jgi:folate-dependent phosphoribosylglycinamide formyltransferase PurN